MKYHRHWFALAAAAVLSILPTAAGSAAAPPIGPSPAADQLNDADLVRRLPGFQNAYAGVNGVRLHYVVGGKGPPLILLSGWPQTWWAFHKIMPDLAKKYRVIAVDIRGQGGSAKPASGYDKKTMAADIMALVQHLGLHRVDIVGHDIGSMVAYSFAANHPDAVNKLIMLEAPHPFDAFKQISALPQPDDYDFNNPNHGMHPWWFAFNQVPGLPEKLLAGREGILLNWMYDYLNRTPDAITPFDRAVYVAAARAPGAITAGNGWYQTIGQDIQDLGTYPKVRVPVLGISGISTPFLKAFLDRYALNASLIEFQGTGHWIAEERPAETTAAILKFLQQP